MARYNGLQFNTELEAIWAAFFDLANWKWWYNPVNVGDWKPDFKVQFDCSHSECGGYHSLFVSVLPFRDISSLTEHIALTHRYGIASDGHKGHIADAGALFGIGPVNTKWEMQHGSGGGIEEVLGWVHNANELWDRAVVIVMNANNKTK